VVYTPGMVACPPRRPHPRFSRRGHRHRFGALTLILLLTNALLLVAPAAAQTTPDSAQAVADSAQAKAEATPSRWFDPSKIDILIPTLLFAALVLGFIASARRGAPLFIRRIPGLDAIDEAIGRATEMGKPILYSPGLDEMDQAATVASMSILGQIAERAAGYNSRVTVPNRDPIVLNVAQEVVRAGYLRAGRPDLYRDDDVYYVTYSQFGYAGAVAGTMVRERPAAIFYMGHFYAESLVMAETGQSTGAIQIAGTDSDAQLPFFITACDYTLIGEELYAASVYLAREPLLLGSLKAQDMAKLIIIVYLIAGVAAGFLGFSLDFWSGPGAAGG
jgi:hypothetical protein